MEVQYDVLQRVAWCKLSGVKKASSGIERVSLAEGVAGGISSRIWYVCFLPSLDDCEVLPRLSFVCLLRRDHRDTTTRKSLSRQKE